MDFLLSDVDSRPVLLNQAAQGHQTLCRQGRILGGAGAHHGVGRMVAVDSFSAEGGSFGVKNRCRERKWCTNRNAFHERGRLHGDSPVMAQCIMV